MDIKNKRGMTKLLGMRRGPRNMSSGSREAAGEGPGTPREDVPAVVTAPLAGRTEQHQW